MIFRIGRRINNFLKNGNLNKDEGTLSEGAFIFLLV